MNRPSQVFPYKNKFTKETQHSAWTTTVGQTIKQTSCSNLRYEKNRALRALIFSAPAGRARSLRELGAFGPYGWPSATWDLPSICPHHPGCFPWQPPWSPHSLMTTPHGPLTHPWQPPMVPSPTPDNPPWSPHTPLTTPYGPLTHPWQPPLVPSLT